MPRPCPLIIGTKCLWPHFIGQGMAHGMRPCPPHFATKWGKPPLFGGRSPQFTTKGDRGGVRVVSLHEKSRDFASIFPASGHKYPSEAEQKALLRRQINISLVIFSSLHRFIVQITRVMQITRRNTFQRYRSFLQGEHRQIKRI